MTWRYRYTQVKWTERVVSSLSLYISFMCVVVVVASVWSTHFVRMSGGVARCRLLSDFASVSGFLGLVRLKMSHSVESLAQRKNRYYVLSVNPLLTKSKANKKHDLFWGQEKLLYSRCVEESMLLHVYRVLNTKIDGLLLRQDIFLSSSIALHLGAICIS
jgi:hypothetical protein